MCSEGGAGTGGLKVDAAVRHTQTFVSYGLGKNSFFSKDVEIVL